jgi:methoxymalonate biosynthesis acyl carrier protein
MTLDPNTVVEKLDRFVRKRFEISADDPDFSSDVHLFDYGYIDSFGAQELISFVETSFGIKITDKDLIKYPLNTLNEIGRFVVNRNGGKA